jgi:general stress protein YciG
MAKKKRGFAAMDKSRQRSIAREGGRVRGSELRRQSDSSYLGEAQ